MVAVSALREFQNGRWLEQEDPKLASSIKELGWVKDGIEGIEAEVIQDLLYIALLSRPVASSIVSLGWVQDGVDGIEAEALGWVNNIGSAEVASSVVSLDWVEDGIDEIEVKAIQEISYIDYRDTEVAFSVVSMDWVRDGIDGIEAEALDWINNMKSAEVASAVVSLGWVADGIKEIEAKAIEELSYVANDDAEIASVIVSMDWFQDGVDGMEAEALDWVNNIGNVEVASSVVSLGWVRDGIEALEVKAIEELSYLANKDAKIASSVVSLGWVADGIDETEVKAIEEISDIAYWDLNVASSVVSLVWVRDGIEAMEVDAIEELSNMAYYDTEVASSAVSLGWVVDGIAATEVALIEDIVSIANMDAGAARRIVDMPFLETIEPPDKLAIASLRLLAAFQPEAFLSVMSHAALRNGISNDLAPIVATLNGVVKTNPDLVDILLDYSKVFVEQRTITLPLAGEVVLFIIRTDPGAARSMELLEHSVRSAEEFMGAPLPTNYVGLLFADAVSGSNAGANFGTHIAILPKYDVADGSHEAGFVGSTIAHEVAHYYWSGNEDWVDEGAADFMASVIDGARTGRPLVVTNPPCGHAGSLAELENLGISKGDIEFRCNYSLGERLFVDLYRTLGYERFRQGFRALYLASEIDDEADDHRGTSVGIEHIREAFRLNDGSESVVISRWYDVTEPYDLSRLDTGPVAPNLPGINGRIEKAYVITSLDGPAVTTFSAQNVDDRVYLALEYAYKVSGGPHEVPLEIVEYFEDGFEFSRRSGELTAEAKYIGGTSWFAVGPSPSRQWAPGRYWVYVYAGEQKVAEVSYEVTP